MQVFHCPALDWPDSKRSDKRIHGPRYMELPVYYILSCAPRDDHPGLTPEYLAKLAMLARAGKLSGDSLL